MIAKKDARERYIIHRIRLIKFHNIQNETITLKGHLFLLGDNGSGKTTLLDAIHYVLAGGDLELNAAARVSGAPSGGRTAQGIVMRYNAETGPLEKSGGITYAALELRNPAGRVLTVGIGMSASSMDEKINRWGFIESKPLEEIPLLIEELQGARPATQLELKKALSNGTYRVNAYRAELAKRLFGGAGTYPDVCRLLTMGKAYREIVSRSADYHELFVRLLPEPHTDIFERLIEGLQNLDGAMNTLNDMKGKLDYLHQLKALMDRVREKREEYARMAWLKIHYSMNTIEASIQSSQTQQKQLRADIEAQAEVIQQEKRKRHRMDAQLDDLKAKDKGGLVRQEKDLSHQYKEILGRLDRAKKEWDQAKGDEHVALANSDRQRGDLAKAAGKHKRVVAAFQLQLDLSRLFQTLDLLTRLDQALDEMALHDPELFDEIAELRARMNQDVFRLQEKAQQLEQDHARTKSELEALEARAVLEPTPVVAARKLLAQHMIDARPLFELLVWKAGVRDKQKAHIEAFIGEQVLTTLVVDSEHFEQAKSLVFAADIGIAISHNDLGYSDYPLWIRDYFDLADPDPLLILAAEMTAEKDPLLNFQSDLVSVAFRGHEQRLNEPGTRWIGIEERRKAYEASRRELQRQLRAMGSELKAARKASQDAEKRLDQLNQFDRLVNALGRDLQARLHDCGKAQLALKSCQTLTAKIKTDLDRINEEERALANRLTVMRELIKEQQLDELDKKIENLQKRIRKVEAEIEQHNKTLGAKQAQLTVQETQESQQRSALLEQAVVLESKAERLRELIDDVEDVAYFVLTTHRGKQFTSLESIENRIHKTDLEIIEQQTTLKQELKNPTLGSVFSFYYKAEDNTLIDRRGRSLDETLQAQITDLREQEQVINEETTALFKQIIHNQLVRELREQVYLLDEMVKHINRLLKNRSFGRGRYQLRQRPVDRCRQLVETIRNLAAFDEGTDQALRDFFEDHKDEIVHTEPGEVPDLLDYRNWYRFEMTVSSSGEKDSETGALAMDRKVKAIGSGGEQAVPNYLLVLTIAYFLYNGRREKRVRLHPLLFDEAFYGIDAGRRDQLLAFAEDLGLQMIVASPDQDGVKKEIAYSKTLLVTKDENYDVYLHEFDWENPTANPQANLFGDNEEKPIAFEPVEPD
jgi:recombinational DNA repair ATPase RecF